MAKSKASRAAGGAGRHLLAVAVVAALAPVPAHAWRLGWFVELGIEWNDNVLLSETDPVEETILRPALGFTLSQEGAVVQAQVAGLVEHRSYLDDTFGSESLAEVEGSVNVVVVPERLHFTVQNRLSVLPITQAAPDAPDNRQQTNVFSAGPTLFFRLSPTLRGQAELRWIDSYAEETAGFDSQRIGAALRVFKDIGPTRTLSLNLQGQDVDLDDNALGPDYQRLDAFARYTQMLNRFDLELDLGYSWYQPDVGDDRTSPLVRGLVGWRATERSRFDLVATRRFSDTAEALLGTVGGDGTVPTVPPLVIIGGETVDSATYEETSIEFGYAYNGVRGDFGFRPYWRELDYVDDLGPDQTGHGVLATASWLLRPTWTLTGDARYERLDFDLSDVETTTRLASLWLRKSFTPHWSGRLGFSRYERDSDESGLSADQNIIYLAVTYTR
jgi:hypothetical protein